MKNTFHIVTLTLLLGTTVTGLAAGCSQTTHDAHHTAPESRSSMPMGHGQHGGHGGHGGMHDHQSNSMQTHQEHMQHAHGSHAFVHDHERMMHDMHSLELTGDADYDFVRGMIPHHQGAIDMARTLLSSGSNAALRVLAQDIITAQEAEIADMQAWLTAYGEPQPKAFADDVRAGYERANQRMMRDMNVTPSGDVDRDFVLGMIPHHEAAIDMAYILLRYSTDESLRSLAKDVIREQEREIRAMRQWLTQ